MIVDNLTRRSNKIDKFIIVITMTIIMTKHTNKASWEKPRIKVLQNLIHLKEGLTLLCGYPNVETKEEKQKYRKYLIQEIMKLLRCNKRTAYDYMITLEEFCSSLDRPVCNAIIGGKKEHLSWLAEEERQNRDFLTKNKKKTSP